MENGREVAIPGFVAIQIQCTNESWSSTHPYLNLQIYRLCTAVGRFRVDTHWHQK